MTIANANATHIETNQDRKEEATTYWFTLEGRHYGTGIEFAGETFGIRDQNGIHTVLDADGRQLNQGDHKAITVASTVRSTSTVAVPGL